MIGSSEVMRQMFQRIQIYAPVDAPVIITGETGTGKELVARAIHGNSQRRDKPFVSVNCTALNEELLESELFGHEKGSFTGAIRTHRGRFERADRGSLFLDEVGDMPPRTQVKLLRVLEQKVLERIGGELELPVDVRIIAATNVSLERSVGTGAFRADLYHRLSVLRIHVPPLRERAGDIPLLVEYYLDNLNQRYRKNILGLSPEAMKLLEEYAWPGNIRELRNVLERIYVETQGTVIGRNAFREWEVEREYLMAGQWNLNSYESQRLSRTPFVSPANRSYKPDDPATPDDGIWVTPYRTFSRALPSGSQQFPGVVDGEFQVTETTFRKPVAITRETLLQAYRESLGNITEASRRLRIHKTTFYRHMQRFGLTREMLETDG